MIPVVQCFGHSSSWCLITWCLMLNYSKNMCMWTRIGLYDTQWVTKRSFRLNTDEEVTQTRTRWDVPLVALLLESVLGVDTLFIILRWIWKECDSSWYMWAERVWMVLEMMRQQLNIFFPWYGFVVTNAHCTIISLGSSGNGVHSLGSNPSIIETWYLRTCDMKWETWIQVTGRSFDPWWRPWKQEITGNSR
jgi:hypothetical protein